MSFVTEPDFDRVLKTVKRTGIPDRIPIMEFFASGEFKVKAMKRESIPVDVDIEFWRGIGMDYIPLYLYWGIPLRRARKRKGLNPNLLEQIEGAVETMEDIEKLEWPTWEAQDWTAFDQVGRYLPDGMKMIAAGGYIFAEAWMLMGFNSFCMALYDDPTIPEELMRRLAEFRISTIKQIIDHPDLGAVWFDDDIAFATGTMVSHEFLSENLFPYMKIIADMCKKRGIPFIYHSDGNLAGVIPDLIELGVDAIQPVEPLAMDAVEVKGQYGNRLSLIGNVEINTLARGTNEEIEQLVIDAARRLGPGGGYAFGSSNTIPAWADYDKYLFFRDCCLKHGTY